MIFLFVISLTEEKQTEKRQGRRQSQTEQDRLGSKGQQQIKDVGHDKNPDPSPSHFFSLRLLRM